MSSENKGSISLLGSSTTHDRNLAVACALELIKADLNSTASHVGNRLDKHMSELSRYADKIETALNKK
ncbi:hypothetical protein [Vibrio casei]|uniref:Uncharacterized protein n=1 Tax=Vibrio casei TaxID=673372 RepID=A0A368LHF2_9VIBR|nr:hypothetical protein [Vibrio casei]RCS70147.1 hypothetical protein CIK83_11820 [Vibrio casei]